MPTALELGKKGWKSFLGKKRYIPHLSNIQQIEREKLINTAYHAATLLKKEFQFTRIILFGSLVHKAWFSEDSDIDLAVEGLPTNQYFKALSRLESMISSRKVDLVDMSEIAEPVKKMIISEGIEL